MGDKERVSIGRLLLAILTLILLVLANTGCIFFSAPTGVDSSGNIYLDGRLLVKGNGDPVCLIDNKYAIEPTYDQVVTFLKNDITDTIPYTSTFVCTDYAEAVHNNAEASGIMAAYVSIDFEVGVGHAINMFNTTDLGPVYIDCTGGGRQVAVPVYSGTNPGSQDKIAYFTVGEEYGSISLDLAKSTDYSFYEQYVADWDSWQARIAEYNDKMAIYNERITEYNEALAAYNRALGGRTKVPEPEYSILMAMKQDLDALRFTLQLDVLSSELAAEEAALKALEQRLGNYRWTPLGIVRDTHIFWGYEPN